MLLLAGIPTPSRVGAPPLPRAPLPRQSFASRALLTELGAGFCRAEQSCWDWAAFQPQLPVPAGLGAAVRQSGLSVCSSAHMSSSPVGLKPLQ